MRAAPPVPCSAVMTLSRTNLPLVAMVWLVTLAVLPRTCTTVVKLVPSAETWMSKSRVFQVVLSPPAPAWRTVKDTIDRVEPRSTCRNLVPETSEHHLSLLHGVEPVAGRFSATLVGPVPPPESKDGGASAAAAPHDVFAVVPRV